MHPRLRPGYMLNDQLAASIISDLKDAHRIGQTLTTVLYREGKALPAPFDKLVVGFLESGGSSDITVTLK